MEQETIPFQWVSVDSKWIYTDEEKRLDASAYSADLIKAKKIINRLKKKGCRVLDFEDCVKDIFHRPRFKRNYTSFDDGEPFLAPTDVFMFPLKPRKYVRDPPDGLKVRRGWILVTCSGTIGRTLIATKQIAKCVLSHDVIRIVPSNQNNDGYIYAYLNTWIGQAFLTKKYGATVKHIEPKHIAEIPVPMLPES